MTMPVSQADQIPADLLSSAYTVAARVESWLGSEYLGAVPVEDGSVSWDASQQVQGSLSLSVPRVGAAGDEDWRDWDPTDPTHPLACFGQVLHVSLTIGSLISSAWWTVPLGRFLITSVEPGPSTVRVTGKSLLQRLEEDRLTEPMAPDPAGSMASELRRLVGSRMGLIIDPALRDYPCPSMTWGESRIDAVYEIARSWPAVVREGGDGILYVSPPTPDPTSRPELRLSDGAEGTVVGVAASVSRDKIYNRVVARGQESSDEGSPSFQAIADQMTGPMRVDGPYGVVPRFFSSPLITSVAQAKSTAEAMLADAVRKKVTVPVEHAPDPRIRLDAHVEVETRPVEGTPDRTVWGVVSAYELPLTYRGTQKTDVEVVQ
nr:MAG TPA: tail protein [Caudoviricetes sp.]